MTTTILDFWAPWCGPCKQLAPMIDELAADYPSISVTKINIDNDPVTASEYHIRSVPTLMIVKDGKVVSTKIGAMPRGKLREWVEANL